MATTIPALSALYRAGTAGHGPRRATTKQQLMSSLQRARLASLACRIKYAIQPQPRPRIGFGTLHAHGHAYARNKHVSGVLEPCLYFLRLLPTLVNYFNLPLLRSRFGLRAPNSLSGTTLTDAHGERIGPVSCFVLLVPTRTAYRAALCFRNHSPNVPLTGDSASPLPG